MLNDFYFCKHSIIHTKVEEGVFPFRLVGIGPSLLSFIKYIIGL